MSIKARILQYLENKNISKYKFYKETGIANGFLDKEGNVGSDKCEIIYSQYPDLSLEWLITGMGQMLKQTSYPIAETLPTIASEPSVKTYKLNKDYNNNIEQLIPLYELSASAGLATLFSSQNNQVPIDHIKVPNAPKCDGAVYVRGDSMYPILKAGDIVCYKTIYNVENLVFGEMFLLDVDNGDDQYLTVKFVKKSTLGDDYVTLVSQNIHHADMDIPVGYIRNLAIIKLSIRYNTIS